MKNTKRILHFIKRISRLMRVLADELDDFSLELTGKGGDSNGTDTNDTGSNS